MTSPYSQAHSPANRFIARVLMATMVCTSLSTITGVTVAFAQTAQPTTSFEYDAQGNLRKSNDSLARATDMFYDPLQRLTRQEQPRPTPAAARPVIQYVYDGLDYLLAITDPRLLTTTYTVNGFGNRVAQASPDTGTTTTSFDGVSNTVTTLTDARSQTTTFSYDALGRVTEMRYGTGVPTQFEYDGGANAVVAARGQMTRMNDESGFTTYAYTDFGEISSKIQTFTANGTPVVRSVAYAYGENGSATGKLSSITYPSGNRVNYRYDAFGRIEALTVNPANSSGGTNTSVEHVLLSNITYAAHGPVQGWQWGNSSVGAASGYSRTFDLTGRIVSYNLGNPATTGSVRTLTWDAANRIDAYTHASSGPGINAALLDQTFSYDDLDRLIGFTANGTAQAFTYDANGNRTSETFGANTYTNTIAANSNRLAATSGPIPAKANIHDPAGNLTGDGTITYTYSARGRMSSATAGTVVSTYLYNGLGQLVRQFYPSADKRADQGRLIVYDEAGHILGEYNVATGAALKEVVYLGEMPVGVLDKGLPNGVLNGKAALNIFYIYADHLATARLITRATDGSIVWRWDSTDPFGLAPPNENPNGLGTFIYNLRMPGQLYDKLTNLFYNYYRDYDPQTGRYIQSDPIGLAGGINTYSYVANDPLSFIDPEGLAACTVSFPDYPIEYADGKTSTWLGGHGGVFGYGSGGGTQYFEYGRYSPNSAGVVGARLPADDGNVRRISIPDLVIEKDGRPTPKSMDALRLALSQKSGKNTKVELTCDANADEKKVYKYAMSVAKNKDRPKYSWKPWSANQCRTFANKAFNAGR